MGVWQENDECKRRRKMRSGSKGDGKAAALRTVLLPVEAGVSIRCAAPYVDLSRGKGEKQCQVLMRGQGGRSGTTMPPSLSLHHCFTGSLLLSPSASAHSHPCLSLDAAPSPHRTPSTPISPTTPPETRIRHGSPAWRTASSAHEQYQHQRIRCGSLGAVQGPRTDGGISDSEGCLRMVKTEGCVRSGGSL